MAVSSLFRACGFGSSSSKRGAAESRRSRGAGRLNRCVAELLEHRTFFSVTSLSNGIGDGTLNITVDAYGSYGSATPAGDALYNPTGSASTQGTTFQSAVYFSPIEQFLSEEDLGGQLGLNSVGFSSTSANEAVSSFTANGFNIVLTQTVGAPSAEGITTFSQHYQITNILTTPRSFRVVRHVDGDMFFVGGLGDDFAGASGDGRFIFEFDTGSDPAASTAYFGITSTGDGTPGGFTIQPFEYLSNIASADNIPGPDLNQINGDGDGDRLTDAGYDVTISLAESFSVPAGGTVDYTTLTIFGQGAPTSILNAGAFAVNSDAPQVSEAGGNATFTVSRTGGTTGAVSVDFTTVDGTAMAGSDYTPVSGTLNFLDGQETATITVPILDDLVSETNESFSVQLSNPLGGAFLSTPDADNVTIVEDDSLTQFVKSGYVTTEKASSVTVIVTRSGSSLFPVTVDYATADGTATAGDDYTAVSGTLHFGAGENALPIVVPIQSDSLAEATETFTINLSNATSGADVGTPGVTTISIGDVDTTGPQIIATSLIPSGKKVREIGLTFDEPLAFIPEPRNYELLDVGKNGPLDGARLKNVSIRSVRYDAATNTVYVLPKTSLKENEFYQIIAAPKAGVTDRSGNALDGDGNGTPGGQYSAYFARGASLTYTDNDSDRIRLKLSGGGAVELWAEPQFTHRRVTLSGISPGRSVLTGRVEMRRVFGNGHTMLETLNGTDGATNSLDFDQFTIGSGLLQSLGGEG